MWELDYKESWVPKNWWFWTVVLENILEHPLDCKDIKPLNPKENQVLNIHWKEWFWSWRSIWSMTSVLFSHSVMSDSLRNHGQQHARLPCPSATPGVCSSSCTSSQWGHITISSSAIPFSSCLQSFPASGTFPESALCIRWSKYWSISFNVTDSNEYSGLISFRTD